MLRLAIALIYATNLYGGLRLFEDPKLPHRDRYAIFADTAKGGTYYFLPLGVKPTVSAAGKPRFGLQHSGYSSQDPAGRTAVVTFSFQLAFTASDVDDMQKALSDLSGNGAALSPAQGYQYTVTLATSSQRRDSLPRAVVAAGTGTVDATTSVTFNLDDLGPRDLYDFFSSDAGLGGLLVQFSVALAGDPARTMVAEPNDIHGVFQSIGPWRAGDGMQALAERILSVVRDPIVPNTRFGRSEQEVLLGWLDTLLPPPDFMRSADGSIFLGWDLSSNAIQNLIQPGAALSWKVPVASGATARFYSSHTFVDFCSQFGDQIVDLTAASTGCGQIWDPQNGNPQGVRKLARLTKQFKDKLIAEAAFRDAVGKLFAYGEITETQRDATIGNK